MTHKPEAAESGEYTLTIWQIRQTSDRNHVDGQDAAITERLEKIIAAMNAVYKMLMKCLRMWNDTIQAWR